MSKIVGGRPTLANLEDDHGFINKATRAYAQSKQYHTIVEGRDS